MEKYHIDLLMFKNIFLTYVKLIAILKTFEDSFFIN